jgi:histidyl-tRNA synthetase
VLRGLGFEKFMIRLNHRGLLAGILENCGVPPALHEQALIAIDKRDKLGREGVARELQTRGIPAQPAQKLLDMFAPQRPQTEVVDDVARFNTSLLEQLRSEVGAHEAGNAAVGELRAITRLCASTSSHSDVIIDPSLARGLSYYTGAIMEVAVPDLAGSLGGGGRYDNLIGMFLGEDIPACGFSLGLERILVVMTARNMFPAGLDTAGADVMITLFEGEPVEQVLALARELRTAGVRVDIYPEPDRLGKQLKYASTIGVRFVAIVGSDERVRGVVTIKDMSTGEQSSVERTEVVKWVLTRFPLNPSPEPRAPSPEPRDSSPEPRAASCDIK